jgi:hypothetical protein
MEAEIEFFLSLDVFSAKWPCLLEAQKKSKVTMSIFVNTYLYIIRGFYDKMFTHLHAFPLFFLPSLLKFFDCKHLFTI